LPAGAGFLAGMSAKSCLSRFWLLIVLLLLVVVMVLLRYVGAATCASVLVCQHHVLPFYGTESCLIEIASKRCCGSWHDVR